MAQPDSSLASKLPIVFEDKHLLAINKPAGWVVNDSKTTQETTVQHWMFEQLGKEQGIQKILKKNSVWEKLVPADFTNKFGTPQEIFLQRQGIVHRLDKNTSGVLLLAKDPGTLVNLLGQFKNRQTRKKYLCLVHGKMKVESLAINAPIARSRTKRFQFRVEIDGRPATTYYQVLDFFPSLQIEKLNLQLKPGFIKNFKIYQQGFSLLECLPETGRTHQIRVHLAHLKHPLVADTVYAGEKSSQLDKLWCARQFLHAWQLQFVHPQSNKKMTVKAELAEDLKEALKYLK